MSDAKVFDRNPEVVYNSAAVDDIQQGEVLDDDDQNRLHRGFKARHVNMIAIAGALGTGLIIGTGTALARGGPGSLLVAYTITGSIVYWVMASLGEMAAYVPIQEGFNGYAARYVDPAYGQVGHPQVVV